MPKPGQSFSLSATKVPLFILMHVMESGTPPDCPAKNVSGESPGELSSWKERSAFCR